MGKLLVVLLAVVVVVEVIAVIGVAGALFWVGGRGTIAVGAADAAGDARVRSPGTARDAPEELSFLV